MLDNKNKKNIMGIINSLNKKGIGIILVTNALGDIKYTKNVVVLKNGRIIFNNKKSELAKSAIKKAGLDV